MEIKDELELPEWMKPFMEKQINRNISKNKIIRNAQVCINFYCILSYG